MRHTTKPHALLRHVTTAKLFADWLREDGDRLVQAADLLGGLDWAARATAVVEAIAEGADPARNLCELQDLRRLLRLEPVDDPESIEALLFASIHPDDPRADDARLCAEALQRGVKALEALARAGVSEIREVA